MLLDYYGEIGCCLTCDDDDKHFRVNGWNGIDGEGCLCYSCKCTKCDWYLDGKCGKVDEFLSSLMYWEDWEDLAKKTRKEALEKFDVEPVNLQATFSNGTISVTIHYCYAIDIPHKIRYYLKEDYPYRYRTLLLKKVEVDCVA